MRQMKIAGQAVKSVEIRKAHKSALRRRRGVVEDEDSRRIAEDGECESLWNLKIVLFQRSDRGAL